jgi:excinuclease UvrABC nuclease subunit
MRYGWSLSRRDWRDVAALCSGKEWKKVPFAEVSRDQVPRRPGVYAICTTGTRFSRGLFSKLYNAVYVGQAENLRRRFLDHCQRPERELRSVIDCFSDLDYWFAPTDISEISQMETVLIDCLGPSANRQRGISARVGPPQEL